MIERTKSYKTIDGQVFADLESAQLHMIGMIMSESDSLTKLLPTPTANWIGTVAAAIMAKKPGLLAILSTKERKQRAPKVVKPRKARVSTHEQSAREVPAAN